MHDEANPSFEDLGELFDHIFSVSAGKLAKLEASSVNQILKRSNAKNILDCSCGTGIPALGLAKLGYTVFASDISPKMIKILNGKTRKSRINIVTKIADFRTLTPWKARKFDAVICTGNSLPLLRTSHDALRAAKSMKAILSPNGVVILGLHNYHVLRRNKELIKISRFDIKKEVQFDIREFGDKRVNVSYFIIRKKGRSFDTFCSTKSYVYMSPAQGGRLLKTAGLSGIRLYNMEGTDAYKGGEWGFAVGFNR